MESLAKLLPLLVGILFIVFGIKTMIKRETTLIIRLWSWGGNDNPRASGGSFSESTQTGFAAILIGAIGVVMGVVMLLRFFTAD